MTLRPPVKWHGGKHYLAKRIVAGFPRHRVYLEPFGGGASVLLNKDPAEVEVYNDTDRRVTRLFRVLRDRGEEFVRRARLTPYSEAEFADAAEYPADASDVDMALCDFVRWRQSFGGRGESFSYTTGRSRGGMAGDVNAWLTAVEALPQIIDRLRRVQILCRSAFEAIPRFDCPDGLIYCDPPYVHATRSPGSRDVYAAELSDDDHLKLAALLSRCEARVVVSGYPSGLYDEAYRGWRVVTFDVPSHAAGGRAKGRRTECLWLNF